MFNFYRVDEYGVRNYSIKWTVIAVILFMTLIILLGGNVLLGAELEAKEGLVKTYEDAVWMLVMASSTIGFGDFYPVTGLGRVIVGITSVLGIGLFAYISSVVVYVITKHTDTEIKNRELRKQNAEIIELSKINAELNEKILESNLELLKQRQEEK